MFAIGRHLGINAETVASTPTYIRYKHLSCLSRNKCFKAVILRYSVTTLKQYVKNAKKFFKFSSLNQFRSLPIDQCCLELFLIDCREKGVHKTSYRCFVSAVKFVQTIYGYDESFSKTFENVLKYLEKFSVVKRLNRVGFQKEKLVSLWHSVSKAGGLNSLSMLELRTFVIINFCYYTMCRFNCISKVKIDNLYFQKEYVKILISSSKTDQHAEGQYVYLPKMSKNCPVKLLCNYIHIYEFDSMENPFLFPPLKWEKDTKLWKPVSNKSVSYTVCLKAFKSLLSKFNMCTLNLSLHSFRVGATSDAFEAGMPEHLIDKRGRWKNSNTKFLYVKNYDESLVKSLQKIV